eukprot:tig00000113_g5572.t1
MSEPAGDHERVLRSGRSVRLNEDQQQDAAEAEPPRPVKPRCSRAPAFTCLDVCRKWRRVNQNVFELIDVAWRSNGFSTGRGRYRTDPLYPPRPVAGADACEAVDEFLGVLRSLPNLQELELALGDTSVGSPFVKRARWPVPALLCLLRAVAGDARLLRAARFRKINVTALAPGADSDPDAKFAWRQLNALLVTVLRAEAAAAEAAAAEAAAPVPGGGPPPAPPGAGPAPC